MPSCPRAKTTDREQQLNSPDCRVPALGAGRLFRPRGKRLGMKALRAAALGWMVLVQIVAGSGLAQTTDTQTWNGVTVRCAKLDFPDGQEVGFEVVKVDPNSAARAAGLRGPLPASRPSAEPSTLLGRIGAMAIPQGQPGDLIVAVEDHRVHCDSNLEEEIAKAKPRDTVYLTIIRSLPDGRQQARKIAIRLSDTSPGARF
jgi:S1-C subfamily serine protease